jgi:hypothetical protein
LSQSLKLNLSGCAKLNIQQISGLGGTCVKPKTLIVGLFTPRCTRDFSPSWLNLDLGGRIPITRNLGLNIFVENLAGVEYEKVNRVYQLGRTFRIGVSSSF